MKMMKMMKTTCAAVAAALLLTLSGGASAEATKGSDMEGHRQMGDGDAMEVPMSGHHEAMVARMDSLDGVLKAKLVAVRDASSDKKKLQALEALVVELVDQRRAMHEGMPAMMAGMMGHMMQRMGAAMASEPGGMMASCPMMQGKAHGKVEGKGAMDGGAAGHEAHH